jgi:type I restriction enzyme S subunit
LADVKKMDFSPEESEKFSLHSGDVLVCEGGEVGRTAIWHGEIVNCCYQKALHRLRPKSDLLQPEILLNFMQYASQRGLLARLTGHPTIAHLTAVKIRKLRVPVPGLDVQGRAIRVFSILDQARERTAQHLSASNSLTRGLLETLLSPPT